MAKKESKPYYLCNIKADATIAEDVEVVAKEMKRDIRFHDHTIPAAEGKTLDPLYNDGYGSIMVHDGKASVFGFLGKLKESRTNNE